MHLGVSPPSLIVHTTFEALAKPVRTIKASFGGHESILAPISSKLDRSLLTPRVLRFLLGKYDTRIRIRYPIPLPDFSSDDNLALKGLPDPQRFQVLMACAIAASCESYKSPEWYIIAKTCQQWAKELFAPILWDRDGQSLAAILLSLIYDLTEPSEGSVWDWLDLAIRTCLQLGWHRSPHALGDSQAISQELDTQHDDDTGVSEKTCLLTVLKEIMG